MFSWSCEDIPRMNIEIIVQSLNVDLKFKSVKQKKRLYNQERYIVMKAYVEKS